VKISITCLLAVGSARGLILKDLIANVAPLLRVRCTRQLATLISLFLIATVRLATLSLITSRVAILDSRIIYMCVFSSNVT
jgi:hypothetical protein